MSLFSTLFNVGIARRVGLWAIVQALPDEDDLRIYLRAAYLGMSGIIIGSVLTGAAISVGLVSAYHLLMGIGWSEAAAIGATAGFTLVLILGCFYMAGRWFTQLVNVKQLSLRTPSLSATVTDAVHSVTEGFMDGLTAKPRQAAPPRKIRLIN